MNWPFVSRSVHDRVRALLIADFNTSNEQRIAAESRADMERGERLSALDAADRRYADLLSKFTTLRLRGAQDPTPPPVAFTPREVDPCVAAINAKFTGNRAGLRAGAMRQLAADRAQQIPDEAILKSIEGGVSDLTDIPV